MEINTVQRFDARAMGMLWAKRSEMDPAQASILKAFYDKRRGVGNEVPVTYNRKLARSEPGVNGLGRLYSNKGSLETLERGIRGALCERYYWDVDMVNCHPVILVQLMGRDDFACPLLSHYVTNCSPSKH